MKNHILMLLLMPIIVGALQLEVLNSTMDMTGWNISMDNQSIYFNDTRIDIEFNLSWSNESGLRLIDLDNNTVHLGNNESSEFHNISLDISLIDELSPKPNIQLFAYTDKSLYIPREPVYINSSEKIIGVVDVRNVTTMVSSVFEDTRVIGNYTVFALVNGTRSDLASFEVVEPYEHEFSVHMFGGTIYMTYNITYSLFYNGYVQDLGLSDNTANVWFAVLAPSGSIITLDSYRLHDSYRSEMTVVEPGNYTITAYYKLGDEHKQITTAVSMNQSMVQDEEYLDPDHVVVPLQPVHIRTSVRNLTVVDPNGMLHAIISDTLTESAVFTDTRIIGNYSIQGSGLTDWFVVEPSTEIRLETTLNDSHMIFNLTARMLVYDPEITQVIGHPVRNANVTIQAASRTGILELQAYEVNDTYTAEAYVFELGDYNISALYHDGMTSAELKDHVVIYRISDIELAREPVILNATVRQINPEINKPVLWTVNGTGITVIPEEAYNITADQPINITVGDQVISIEEFNEVKKRQQLQNQLQDIAIEKNDSGIMKIAALTIREMRIRDDIEEIVDIDVSNATILLNGENLIFETEAPELITINKTENHEKLINITVRSNATVHYYNVSTYIDINEVRAEQIKLFWNDGIELVNIIDDERFNVTLVDANRNGLIEQVRWITPKLSEQNFELEIDLTVLNIKSNPTLLRNWSIGFETIGQANLTITAIDGTSWTEFLTDIDTTRDDLVYQVLYCGENDVEIDVFLEDGTRLAYSDIGADNKYRIKSLFVENWECNTTATLINRIITTGRHDLMLEFGNDVNFAQNMGFLLYEDFESYSNNSNATYFKDFDSVQAEVDSFLVFDNGTSKFYRGDASAGGATWYVSTYNETNALFWQDYEVRTKLRMTTDDGTQGNGIYLYSKYGNSDDWIRITSEAGTYRVTQSSGLLLGDSESGVTPVVGTWYILRAMVWNSAGDTYLNASVWAENTTEPAAWQISSRIIFGNPNNGSIGLFAQDSISDFEYVIVENISHTPVLNITSPEPISYGVSDNIWFNVTTDKMARNCSYDLDGTLYNLTALNWSTYYDNQTISTYGVRTVWFYCEDYQGNIGNASVTISVGSGRVSIPLRPIQQLLIRHPSFWLC